MRRKIKLTLSDGTTINLKTGTEKEWKSVSDKIQNEKLLTIRNTDGSETSIKCANIDKIETKEDIQKTTEKTKLYQIKGKYYRFNQEEYEELIRKGYTLE